MLISFFFLYILTFFSARAGAAGVPTPTFFQENDPSIQLSAGWSISSSLSCIGGSFASTTVVGAALTVELPLGTEDVEFFGFRNEEAGLFAVCVDCNVSNSLFEIFDAHAAGVVGDGIPSVLFSVVRLNSSVAHVLTVVNLPDPRFPDGPRLMFDALLADVDENPFGGILFPSIPISSIPIPAPVSVPDATSSTPSSSASSISSAPDSVSTPPASGSVSPKSPGPPSQSGPVNGPISAPSGADGGSGSGAGGTGAGGGGGAGGLPSDSAPPGGSQPTAGAPAPAPGGPSPVPGPGPTGNPTQSAPAATPTGETSDGAGSGSGAGGAGGSTSVSSPSGTGGSAPGGPSGTGAPSTSGGPNPTGAPIPTGGSATNSLSGSGSPSPTGSPSGSGSPSPTGSSQPSGSSTPGSGSAPSSTTDSPAPNPSASTAASNGGGGSRLSTSTIAVISIISVFGFLSIVLGGIVIYVTRSRRLGQIQRLPSLRSEEAGMPPRFVPGASASAASRDMDFDSRELSPVEVSATSVVATNFATGTASRSTGDLNRTVSNSTYQIASSYSSGGSGSSGTAALRPLPVPPSASVPWINRPLMNNGNGSGSSR